MSDSPLFDTLAGILARPGMYMYAGSSWDALMGYIKGIEFAAEVHGFQDDVVDAWRRFTRWMIDEWPEAIQGPFWPAFRAQHIDDLQALAALRDAYQRYCLVDRDVSG